MKYYDPLAGKELLPVILAVNSDTAKILKQMADDMDLSLDEVVSTIADDSVIGLSVSLTNDFFEDVIIPDSFTMADLNNYGKRVI